MKHPVAFAHPLATLQAALAVRPGRSPTSIWVTLATAATVAVRRHIPTPARSGARTQPVTAPADAQAAPREQAAPRVAAPAATAAARWERHGARAAPWVEGLVLFALIGFFGAGLVAILGGY